MNPNAITLTFYCFDRDCSEGGYSVRDKSRAACIKRAIAEGWRNIGADAWLCPRCAAAPTAERQRDELLAACKGILAMREAMVGKGSYSKMEEEALDAVAEVVAKVESYIGS